MPLLVAENSGVMLHQSGGKLVGAVFFGNKVQIGCGGGVEHRLNRCSPGIAYGTGGQTSSRVCIIGSVSLEIGSREVAIEILKAIDHRGIALKANPFL